MNGRDPRIHSELRRAYYGDQANASLGGHVINGTTCRYCGREVYHCRNIICDQLPPLESDKRSALYRKDGQ